MPRKDKEYHYIYKTTCIVTGKFYVGMHSTDNIEDGYNGSGKRLGYSVRKYGRENHIKEILEFLPDRSSLKIREAEIVNEVMIQNFFCMNLVTGGSGGFVGKNGEHLGGDHFKKANEIWQTEDGRNRRRELTSRLWKDLSYRTKVSNSLKGNITFLGKNHSEETKQKMREKAQQRTGDKNSSFGTCWIFHEDFGNKKIKKIDLDTFLSQGWKKGRI